MNKVEMILWIIGCTASAFFSWLFTHIYYKKALKQQANEFSKQMAEMSKALNKFINYDEQKTHQLIIQDRINKLFEEYKKTKIIIPIIDSYNDMTDDEKADLLDTVLMMAKGKKAKENKYRQN